MALQNSLKRSKILSFEDVLAELESAKKNYKEFNEGHREALYQSQQRVAEAAVFVTADEKIETRYRKKMGNKDALRAALMFIFDPQSVAERKEASKRTSALWYLIVKEEVPVEDIANAIPKHGGIEKLARLTAKSRADEDDKDQDEDDEDQDDPEDADEGDKPKHVFGKLLSVGLSPKLTKKLNRFADKTRIKIIGHIRMLPDESPTIEATKIVKLVSKVETETKKEAVTKKETVSKKKGGKSKRKSEAKKAGDDDADDDVSDWD